METMSVCLCAQVLLKTVEGERVDGCTGRKGEEGDAMHISASVLNVIKLAIKYLPPPYKPLQCQHPAPKNHSKRNLHTAGSVQ